MENPTVINIYNKFFDLLRRHQIVTNDSQVAILTNKHNRITFFFCFVFVYFSIFKQNQNTCIVLQYLKMFKLINIQNKTFILCFIVNAWYHMLSGSNMCTICCQTKKLINQIYYYFLFYLSKKTTVLQYHKPEVILFKLDRNYKTTTDINFFF